MAPITLAELAVRPIWVGWRHETRDGKPTKVPYNSHTGRRAECDNPSTWSTHDEAAQWSATKHADGVGLMLCPVGDVRIGGVDLDTCRDPNTGDVAPWAQEVVDRFNTYTEISPSQTGVKLFFTYANNDIPAINILFDGKRGRSFKNAPAGDRNLCRGPLLRCHQRADQLD